MKKQPIVYGIPNCDTVKKARQWLTDHDIAATFHDFKKQGVPPDHLDQWLASAGWEKLVNRKGTLSTAGNLVFQGTTTGRAVAYAADSGKELWSANVNSGVGAAPMTYEVKGAVVVVMVLAGVVVAAPAGAEASRAGEVSPTPPA